MEGPGLVIIVIDAEYNISPPIEDGDFVALGAGKDIDVLDGQLFVLPISVWGYCVIDGNVSGYLNGNFLLSAV